MAEKKDLREILFQIDHTRRQMVKEFLLEIGLTPGQGQARILQYLAANEAVTQRVLAEQCLLDVTTMSRTLDRLEDAGLLKRIRNPQCRRSYLIQLTEEGYQKAKAVEKGFQKLDEILCEGLEAAELEWLVKILGRVEGNLQREPTESPADKK